MNRPLLKAAEEGPRRVADLVNISSVAGRQAGVCGWTKVRCRNSTEALIGGITGFLHRPQVLLVGRYDTTGRPRLVESTAPLNPARPGATPRPFAVRTGRQAFAPPIRCLPGV
ncbi:hypothetical protein [Streptomyces sp. NPDC048438]|uniref:hypothetical protein n=1 Tax=Streptomyces sp. NPDC048438 TaxID=3365551 RepID=UPI00371DC8F3